MSRVLVVDASVVVELLARFRPQPIEDLLWAPDTVLAAPELIDIEVLHALRELDQAGAIPPGRCDELPTLMRALRIRKYRHDSLVDGENMGQPQLGRSTRDSHNSPQNGSRRPDRSARRAICWITGAMGLP